MLVFEKLFEENRVWTAIQTHLKTKRNPRTLSFNCPMCVTRNETPDKRMRGGIINDLNGIAISCFNCGFKTRWKMGDLLNKNIKYFMEQIGVPSIEIARLNHWSLSIRNMIQSNIENNNIDKSMLLPSFSTCKLPEESRLITELIEENFNDPDFLEVITYLFNRGEEIFDATTYYWSPIKKNEINRRIIIPCYYGDSLVGWTARTIDSINPKYFNRTQPDFLFNSSALDNPNRQIVILVEGIFDALAIDGVGLLGNKLNERQVSWINDCGKRIIVLPDRDKAGNRLIDLALEYNWEVSFPRPMAVVMRSSQVWWESEIDDAADAVKHYGKLYTIKSIISAATDNRMKIKMQRKD